MDGRTASDSRSNGPLAAGRAGTGRSPGRGPAQGRQGAAAEAKPEPQRAGLASPATLARAISQEPCGGAAAVGLARAPLFGPPRRGRAAGRPERACPIGGRLRRAIVRRCRTRAGDGPRPAAKPHNRGPGAPLFVRWRGPAQGGGSGVPTRARGRGMGPAVLFRLSVGFVNRYFHRFGHVIREGLPVFDMIPIVPYPLVQSARPFERFWRWFECVFVYCSKAAERLK